jgi:predicted Zn finger-like uncharacterized protein
MLIACPNCETSYQLEPSSLGPAGRSVRCVRCRKVWFAANTAALAAIAQDHRAEVVEFTAATPIAGLMAAAESPAPEPLQEPAPEPAPELVRAETVDDTVEIGDVKADWAVEVDPVLAAQARSLAASDDAPPLVDDLEPPPSNAAPHQEPIPQSEELITITDAPELVPVVGETIALRPAYMGHVEPEAERGTRRHSALAARGPRPRLSTAILVLLAINTALIAWRADVVRFAPQTAALYAAIGLPVNIRGLTFADITTEHAMHDGVPVLVVEGTIVSATARTVEVPRLRFALRNDSGLEIYSWTAMPTRSVLSPGESLSFRSRLASPPPEGHSVVVRFFNRHDQVAGIQ